VKSLVYAIEDGFAFVLVRGDHQVNDGKLEAALGPCRPAEPDEVRKLTGADIGFVSPIGIKGTKIIADPALEGTTGLVAGANENHYHFTGVDMARDINVDRYVPLRGVVSGETCIKCGGTLDVARAIEVGHIFKLGTRYSEALGASFLDENGETRPVIMGSYGIGVERIMASAVERFFDGSVMKWPREIAPFLVEVLPLNVTSDDVRTAAENLYEQLRSEKVPVLMDDRDERAGVKFKDADLFGIPVVVVVGERGLKEGVVEFRVGDRGVKENVPLDTVLGLIHDELSKK
jgi:prolyl-tRNA synthetase